MTLSVNIYTARKEYKCEGGCNGYIKIGEKYARFFGSPDDNCKNPPPYEMKECSKCASAAIRYYEENK